MDVVVSPRFMRAYRRLTSDLRGRVDEALRKFVRDPRHPGLHFEKLSGSDYRTIRPVKGAYRIVLRQIEGGKFELVDVDTHKLVDSKYG